MKRIERAALVAALTGLALAGCGAGGPRSDGGDEAESEYRGMVLSQPLAKPDFTLTDTEGEPFDFRAETDGYLTLLFFGYTHCPDVCPVHMANLAAVLQELPVQTRKRIKVVFVSVDPARDTPERIREWLHAFDPSFIGLRGTREEVDAIMTGLSLPAAVIEEAGDGEGYLVGHATQIMAFTADNVARVVYPFGTRQADWAYDLPRLARIEPTLRVAGAYAAEPVTGERTALYLTVENHGEEDDELVSVSAEVAGRAELHRSIERDGVMRMEPVAGVPVPAGGSVRLAPGGYHVMLLELREAPRAGDEIRATLEFRRAGRIHVRAEVRPYAELESLVGGGAMHGRGGGH